MTGMLKLVFFCFLIFATSFSCTRGVYPSNDGIYLAIDSLYVDEVETASTLEQLPALYYFCSVRNETDSVVDLLIAKYPGEEIEGSCFICFNGDTIKMNLDAQPLVTIPANGEKAFWLKTNTFDFTGFMDKSIKESENELQLLKNLIKESTMVIEQNDRVIEARAAANVKIKYKILEDKTID